VARCDFGNAQARGAHALLHELLVAEAAHDVDAHAGHAPALAQLRGEDDERLPVREHAIDLDATEPLARALDDVFLVHDARHLQVAAQRLLHHR
jgi:hypothetical protein